MLKIAIPCFSPFFDEDQIKGMQMEKETVLILLLLKPMTKPIQLNDIVIMIYHGGCPVLKTSIPCFLLLFW